MIDVKDIGKLCVFFYDVEDDTKRYGILTGVDCVGNPIRDNEKTYKQYRVITEEDLQ